MKLGVSARFCLLAALAARIRQEGFNDLVLHFTTGSLAERFQTNSVARRAALRDSLVAEWDRWTVKTGSGSGNPTGRIS